MFHCIRQSVFQTIPGAALDDLCRVRDEVDIFAIGVIKHLRLVNDIVVAIVVVPFHAIALCFVVCCQLHEAEIGKVVAVHIDESYIHVRPHYPSSRSMRSSLGLLLPSGVSQFSLTIWYICSHSTLACFKKFSPMLT